MATLQEIMTADFTYSLEEEGEEIKIDGVDLQAFVTTLETPPGEFARTFIISKKIRHLPGAIPEKVPGEIVTLDGERSMVIDHRISGPSACLILERSAG